ncbi:hypothetical protein SOCE26_055570 [Sorangium cellulosum]|uniref:Uncharacterized protein n=1 Tax=Sorangium cellulosum TaxID=56 RepID=A0A2L0EXR5_SORCE|nr:hypothetical protein [Sorangium cellulosum]AUX44097.1 hypothetical protein SOCE26_055570 [Sorangium cellulosum]
MSGSGNHVGESGLSRPKAAAPMAALGLLAATGIVCGAVALRNPATVTALERNASVAPGPATAASSPSSGPRGDKGAASAPAPAAAASAPAGAPAGTEPEPPPKAEPARAQPAEIERAQATGSAALGTLAERYPDDPVVLRELALAQAREKASTAALLTAKRLFEIAPEETGNDELRQFILRAANGAPDIAVTALDLMAKHMGSRGPDLLYEVVTAPRFGDYPRDSASKLLIESSVRQLASPALIIADDLRRVTGCPTKPLIARAREEGDLRALHYIKQLLAPYRCGTFRTRNCIRCGGMHKDLRAAASAIEKRKNDKAAAAPAASSAAP